MKKFASVALILFLCVAGTAFAQQEVIIQGQDTKGVPRAISADTEGRMLGQIYVIDDCEVVPGWTALSNDTTGIEIDLDHVMGAVSLEWDKVDGADNLTVGGIQKNITALDLTSVIENGGAFGYSLNISAIANIEYCFLRLGTDASNYNEWRIEGTSLSTGWNSLRFNTDAPATAGATGNGWNPSVVSFISLGCGFKLETDALADIRVDHVIVHMGFQVAADINASVSSSGGATKVDLVKVKGTPTDVNAGASGLGTQRVVNATDDPNLSKLTVEDLDTTGATDNKQVVGIVVPSAAGAVVLNGDANGMDMDINAQTLTALKVSATAAVNALGNPMFFQISQDGTNAVDATHPLPVSKDMATNTTANRIWVKSDTDQLGGNAINTNGGNRDAGTATVTLADDDPAVANLTDIEGLLTSDNDAKELADYFDSTSQIKPFYVDDAALALDNEPLADVMAAIYDQWGAVITLATTSVRVEEIDPLDQKYIPSVVANVTNGTDAGGTTCPAGTDFCYYIDMEGYQDGGFQFALDCDAGTVTATIECTVMSTGAAAATYVYHDVTLAAFGIANLQATAGVAGDLWIDNAGKLGQCKYVLVRIAAATGGGNTGDWRIDHTKSAL